MHIQGHITWKILVKFPYSSKQCEPRYTKFSAVFQIFIVKTAGGRPTSQRACIALSSLDHSVPLWNFRVHCPLSSEIWASKKLISCGSKLWSYFFAFMHQSSPNYACMCASDRSLQRDFPTDSRFLRSGDIHAQVPKLTKIVPKTGDLSAAIFSRFLGRDQISGPVWLVWVTIEPAAKFSDDWPCDLRDQATKEQGKNKRKETNISCLNNALMLHTQQKSYMWCYQAAVYIFVHQRLVLK